MGSEALAQLVAAAHHGGASDLHLQPGYPPMWRVHGRLIPQGAPLQAEALESIVRALGDDDALATFTTARALDLARALAGVRCRINVFATSAGPGLAVRLFQAGRPTLARLNLPSEFRRFAEARHGLVLVAGATGSGKTSTLAALVDVVDEGDPRHVITLEEPIEHVYTPRRALVRQREVGRDTPSFAEGLRDALRENPDVVVVGELRDFEVMRLVLGAAETGHLVFATIHAGSSAEALQRLVLSFPPEAQAAAAAQLGDCLQGVICQRLVHRTDLGFRVPECEVLAATTGVRGVLRQAAFSKLQGAIEAGGADGMYTFERYAATHGRRTDFVAPDSNGDSASPPQPQRVRTSTLAPPPARPARRAAASSAPPARATRTEPAPVKHADEPTPDGVLEIPAMEESAAEILDRLSRR